MIDLIRIRTLYKSGIAQPFNNCINSIIQVGTQFTNFLNNFVNHCKAFGKNSNTLFNYNSITESNFFPVTFGDNLYQMKCAVESRQRLCGLLGDNLTFVMTNISYEARISQCVTDPAAKLLQIQNISIIHRSVLGVVLWPVTPVFVSLLICVPPPLQCPTVQ